MDIAFPPKEKTLMTAKLLVSECISMYKIEAIYLNPPVCITYVHTCD